MPDLNQINSLIARIDRALMFLKAERRDEKREYDNAIRKLEQAHTQLMGGIDCPELVDVEATLSPELTALLENPTLKR